MLEHCINKEQNENIKYEPYEDRHGIIYSVQGNLFITKASCNGIPMRFVNSSRGHISGFSMGSASRMRRYLRTCKAEYNYIVTLTYPGFYPSDGAMCKQHLRRMLQEIRREVFRIGQYSVYEELSYSAFWFLEFQSRGAPHFHILTTHDINKKWLSRRWYEIVGSEDDRHLAAGTNIEQIRSGRAGIMSYAAKYAQKQHQKVVPEGYENVGRFWGVSGYRVTVSADTYVKRSEMRDPLILSSVNRLKNQIVELESKGYAILLRRSQGVRIYKLNNAMARDRIFKKVMFLSLKTGRTHDLFQDAEVDHGDKVL